MGERTLHVSPIYQNPGNVYLRNAKSWALKSVLKESGILLIIGIRNPDSPDKESGIQYLESGIHCVKSRIQDCL